MTADERPEVLEDQPLQAGIAHTLLVANYSDSELVLEVGDGSVVKETLSVRETL